MGWRPALAQVRRDAPYRARGGAARQRPRHAVPGRRQAGGGFCAARPGADALAPRAEGGFRSGGDFQSRPALRRDVMQTGLADFIRNTPEGAEAAAILRKCVHCGFCTATCPTYQILGDDLDSPRGRIYLIKRALEGAEVTQRTRLHLDRCLTCRACETTCPSGVRYGRLVDIGRAVVEAKTHRGPLERAYRTLLAYVMPRTWLFDFLLRLGQLTRPLLPPALTVKEYAHLLEQDPEYRDKAARISSITRDLCEVIAPEMVSASAERGTVAFQSPCTLQHGQQLRGKVEALLEQGGYTLQPVDDAH